MNGVTTGALSRRRFICDSIFSAKGRREFSLPTNWVGAAIAAGITVILKLCTVIYGAVSAYFWRLSSSIAWNNRNNTGVIIELKFWLAFSVRSQ